MTNYSAHSPHPGSPRIVSHAPDGYVCPFCGLVNGNVSDPNNRCEITDLIYQDDDLVVFVAVDGFGPRPGHVMISPAQHYETLYELPDRVLQRISLMAREVALAMKRAWNPDGVSTRQHNEPAGNQHVWHYHLHIFPRYEGDQLYRHYRAAVEPEFRQRVAEDIKAALNPATTKL